MSLRLDHLYRLTDGTGIFQHALGTQPNPEFGYCLDDNARALTAAIRAHALTGDAALLDYIDRYLGFVERAHRPDGRFRNFMGAGGAWLEKVGSDDSNGRAVWALGYAAWRAPSAEMRIRALSCLQRVRPYLAGFTWLRSQACVLIGLDYWRRADPASAVDGLQLELTEHLAAAYASSSAPDWQWFEDELTYSNAHLAHALLDGPHQAEGLQSLAWLCELLEVDDALHLIGSNGFYRRGGTRAVYDQQAVDAEATLEACLAALKVSGDCRFRRWADMAFGWFSGQNVGRCSMIDSESGGCYDGLTPAGVNTNQGAESLLAWLLAQEDMLEAGIT